MKFIILKEYLGKVLSVLNRNIPNRPQLPILSNILIKTDKSKAIFSVSNLELGIVYSTPAKIETEGEITVTGKLLCEFVNTLSSDKVEFTLEGTNLLVSTNNTHASFTTIPSSDFPSFPQIPENKKTFSFEKIKDSIGKTVFAASTDEGRPVLTGVRTEITKNSLKLASTDGYRLSLDEVIIPEQDEELKMILPAKTLSEVVRIAQETKTEEINLGMIGNKNQAVFSFSDLNLFTRLIDGEFPNIGKIIPSSFKTKVTVETEILAKSVKTASLFARGAANIIKIKIEKLGLRLSANTPQVGTDEDFLEAKVEGEEMEIAFNYRFLLDLLLNFTDKEIVMELSGSLNPGVFKSTGSSSSFLHIIMPVRVQT